MAHFQVPVYYEKVIDNEYLEDFYADMKKYSFQLQVYLLNIRFRQHQQIIWQGRGAVQDRSIYEDRCAMRDDPFRARSLMLVAASLPRSS